MIVPRPPIPRRTFLRGVGAALALPYLEAMTPRGWAAGREPATRLAFLFFPNGAHMTDWTPAQEGKGFPLSPILEPLAPFREHLLVLSGLAHHNARALGDGPGDHARAAACYLTGAHPFKTAGSNIEVGVSVDQVAARHLGQRLRFPSLELGIESGRQSGSCDSGYSCAYSSNVSWRTPHTPVPKEVNPGLLFRRLFMIGPDEESAEARTTRLRMRRSILDLVGEDARRLQGEVGANDRRKLDEYFDSVREVERRLELAQELDRDAGRIGMERPPAGIPGDYGEHVDLMFDLMVLAFRLDLTRVVTFMLGNAGSNRSYRNLGVPEGHHELSHHGKDPEKERKIAAINRYHCELLAGLLGRMGKVQEAEGRTLLDSTAIVFGSAIGDGNRHNHDDLPVLVAGRANGLVRTGRHVQHLPETPMCNLYLSLLQGVGVKATSFGDSTGPLEGLA